ncbi:MAG: hypothetical protein WBD31_23620, partial [Rubripirellula sp.]
MRHTLLAIIVLILGLCDCLAQDSDAREAEAISIGQAYAANWDALGQYDLLMTLETFEMKPNGGTTEQLETLRLISDHENWRFCFAERSKQEVA